MVSLLFVYVAQAQVTEKIWLYFWHKHKLGGQTGTHSPSFGAFIGVLGFGEKLGLTSLKLLCLKLGQNSQAQLTSLKIFSFVFKTWAKLGYFL